MYIDEVNKQSEPVKHIRKHPNHKFTWKVLTTVHSWRKKKRRIKEAFTSHASAQNEINKCNHWTLPSCSSWEQVLRNWQYLNTERMHIFHSDDDLLDRKRLDSIIKQLLTLSFKLYYYYYYYILYCYYYYYIIIIIIIIIIKK